MDGHWVQKKSKKLQTQQQHYSPKLQPHQASVSTFIAEPDMEPEEATAPVSVAVQPPVQEAAAPCSRSDDTEESPRHMTRLRAASTELQRRAGARLAEARALAQQGADRLVEVAAPITARIATAVEVVQQKKEAALQFCDAGFVAVTATFEHLRRDGVRPLICSTAQSVRVSTLEAIQTTRNMVLQATRAVETSASDAVKGGHKAAAKAAGRAGEVSTIARTKAVEVATDANFQAAAVGAAGGAAALGATGGASGLLAGASVGAMFGLIPAIFTFGLSIPIGAAIGGGAGLVVGATVGSAAGALGGGAAGYGAYSKRSEIRDGAQHTMSKVNTYTDYMKGRAYASADYVKEKASVVRTRLVGSGTGGTELSD